jgi:hypothetical protein
MSVYQKMIKRHEFLDTDTKSESGADWPLWQCGKCREAFVISHTKCHKKRLFRNFKEFFVWNAAEAF